MRRVRVATLFGSFAAASLAALLGSLLFGSVPISLSEVLQTIVPSGDAVTREIVWNLRAPRVFAAYACGGLLAIAGALLQVLLRNALADPYVLGVSGGASLGALLALAAGTSVGTMNTAAVVGAASAIAIVFAVTFRAGDWNVYRMLLTGVVLSAGLSAVISLVLVLAPEAQVKGMLFWLMGDLSQAGSPISACIILVVLTALGVVASLQLDLLALGELKARALGVTVLPLQVALFAAATTGTVTAVVLGGAIGFVGLIVPHAVRLAGVAHHRALLPLSAMLGGTLLAIADTAARTAWSPQQLPVGIFTALLGVPAMLMLLGRRR
jgi:iron complex transport system permease protein